MSDFHPRSTRWMAGLVLFIALMAFSILGRLYYVSIQLGPELVAAAREKVIQEREIPASRGNIYSADGQLLATSMPVYELRWDASIVEEQRFLMDISETCLGLSKLLPSKTSQEWDKFLRTQFNLKKKYSLVAKDLSFTHYRRIAELPLFKGNRFKSGLIVEEDHTRFLPLGILAERTIGYRRPDASAGLEASYHTLLKGQNGKRWMQHLGANQWKPMESSYTLDPQSGKDIITTLNSRMQDVAHRALLKALQTYQADHGCAVLMEVKTGKIRAMVNLGRTPEDTSFKELRNYAVWEKTEPGSTFKVAALLIGLEDGMVDTADKVNTSPGYYKIYDRKVTDSHKEGYGRISLGRALELSSNTGIVKLLYPKYSTIPEAFIDRMYQLGLADKTGIEIRGESAPHIPKPGDKDWYGTTLPWMFFGYGVQSTPLQTLTFYNAIANDGEMVAPSLWEATREKGTIIDNNEPRILHPAIASSENLHQIQDLLEKVVIRGTANNIFSDSLRMAGKTGTCQLNYWDPVNMGYQASFAGYFPADNPQYSCIVVINRPMRSMGFYANIVAAPVFRDIAIAVNRMTPEISTPAPGYYTTGISQHYYNQSLNREMREERALESLENDDPSILVGWPANEAIALLESHGYTVKLRGNGRVKKASKQNKTVELDLG
jgi:cell division protein FtsI (penicillin-binding protein 3)